MKPESWRYTRLPEERLTLPRGVDLQAGELPIVTSFISDSSCYTLTSRRVLGQLGGQDVDVPSVEVLDASFGNFKGYWGAETEVMTLICGETSVRLEYETGRASMAPIYYFRFWKIKYPVLDKLQYDPG